MALDYSNVLYGMEIPGLSEEVCFWAMKDGSVVNRFNKELSPTLWEATEEYLDKLRVVRAEAGAKATAEGRVPSARHLPYRLA